MLRLVSAGALLNRPYVVFQGGGGGVGRHKPDMIARSLDPFVSLRRREFSREPFLM